MPAMLTCVLCSKATQQRIADVLAAPLHSPREEEKDAEMGDGAGDDGETSATRQAIKALTSQMKGIALKAAGAYRRRRHHPYAGCGRPGLCYTNRRTAAAYGSSGLDAEHHPLRAGSGDAAPPPAREKPEDGDEEGGGGNEWVAVVDPGVLITFSAAPHGAGNHLKKIRFSREMFTKSQAHKWWAVNYDRVVSLYNVTPLPAPPKSAAAAEESLHMEVADYVTPPLLQDPLAAATTEGELSSPDSACRQSIHDTPMQKSSSGKERKSTDKSGNHQDDACNKEWVEEDEPGVFITIRALPAGGTKELRRVRFCCERFTEMQARQWWEENRARIHKTYLSTSC